MEYGKIKYVDIPVSRIAFGTAMTLCLTPFARAMATVRILNVYALSSPVTREQMAMNVRSASRELTCGECEWPNKQIEEKP